MNFTISMWIRPDGGPGAGNTYPFALQSITGSQGALLIQRSNVDELSVLLNTGSSGATCDSDLTMGQQRWNHIVITREGSKIIMYLNATQGTNCSFAASLYAPAEIDFLTDKFETPVIYDGAKLNFLMTSVASPAGLLTRGYLEFIWT